VKRYNVQLPDEYDDIYRDLEPFWGIPPKDLLAIQTELESQKDTYTVGKDATHGVAVVKTSFHENAYDQLIKGTERIVDLLKEIEDYLPPFRA
jgi:hypothetical protein